jgi:hypothetical protein
MEDLLETAEMYVTNLLIFAGPKANPFSAQPPSPLERFMTA